MAEELGKIEKPPVDNFKNSRKLFFIPLVFLYKEFPEEYKQIYTRYWEQVESQITNLETKLGTVKHIFHELISDSGENAINAIQQLNVSSIDLIKKRTDTGAVVAATEDKDILAELMDWSRCLSIGLQSHNAYNTIYGFYTDANKRRTDFVLKSINETLKADEIGILIMAEGQHIQFPSDIQIFYVAPPALDEIKRWLRDYETKAQQSQPEESETTEETTPDKKPEN